MKAHVLELDIIWLLASFWREDTSLDNVENDQS